MGRGEVAENQRQRMLGAMVEAAAANGYGGTSVRQVVSLAGVSRRAFYEQFTNKQDCFLATLELIACRAGERVQEAYRSAGPEFGDRMAAALKAYSELIGANPKSAHLAMIEAPAAGAPGWERLTKMLLAFEQRLSASFLRTPGATPLPSGVIRGMAGGLHRIAFIRLRERRTAEMAELVEDMLEWTLAMQSPAARSLGSRVGSSATRRASPDSPLALSRPMSAPTQPRRSDERTRMLDSALEMAALEGYENLSPLRIVDHASVSIDTFFSLFGDLETCFMEALLGLAEAVIASVRIPGLDCAEQWPLAVPRALRSLMGHFARNPTHAHMVATGAYEMGSSAVSLNVRLADVVARRLLQGAPAEPGAVVREATAGAIWHTVYCHVVSQQVARLPLISDQLAYVILAPAMGGDQAVATLTDAAEASTGASVGERIGRLGDAVGTARI
jgi:AcrR family transcriptional regulator